MPNIGKGERKTSTLRGRMAVVTVAGRGIGRKLALLQASKGADPLIGMVR